VRGGDHPSIVEQGAAAGQLLAEESRLDNGRLQQCERLVAHSPARYIECARSRGRVTARGFFADEIVSARRTEQRRWLE